jgi:hypothetical protein
VPNDTHDVHLAAFLVNRITHSFAVDGQTFINNGMLLVPAL